MLEIKRKYDKPLDMINEGVEILQLPEYELNVNDLPSSIETIYIGKSSIFPIPDSPPKNINKLYHGKIKYYDRSGEYYHSC